MPSYKVIKSGHIIEIYEYEGCILKREDDLFKSVDGGRDKEGKEERKKEYSNSVNQKARNKLRRLINANFTEKSLFITLTYKKNMKDIESANNDLKKFVQKMKRKQKNFQYVAVIEFQKRGAIHYHLLCNYELPFLVDIQNHERILAGIWGHGFVDIQDVLSVDNVGAYLTKYMSKDVCDERLIGKKRYFFSRSLIQPKEMLGGEAVQIIKEYLEMPPVFTNEYYSEFHGHVKFREYNSKRYDYNQFKEVKQQEIYSSYYQAVEIFGGDYVEWI